MKLKLLLSIFALGLINCLNVESRKIIILPKRHVFILRRPGHGPIMVRVHKRLVPRYKALALAVASRMHPVRRTLVIRRPALRYYPGILAAAVRPRIIVYRRPIL